MIEKNIYLLLEKAFNKEPQRIFLKSLDDNEVLNYEDAFKLTLKFNRFLNQNKIKKQNKIIVIFDNSVLLSFLFLGVTSTNRIFVPVNPEIGNYEFLHILKTANPDFFILDDKYRNKFYKFLKKKKYLFVKNHQDFIDDLKKENTLEINKNFNGISEVLYTSGSTGKPKGVVLTHKSILSNLHGLDKSLNLEKYKNFLAITPLFHNNGQFLPTLMCIKKFGSSLPIISKTSLRVFWDIVAKTKIHYSSVMVTHISYLLYEKKNIRKHSLKALFCGGAKLDLNTQNLFEKKFRVKICCNYGLTETSSIVATENLNKKSNLGSVGKPLFNNKIKIVNIKKENDYKGEIIVKGENNFLKYLKNKKKTLEVKKNGWFYTGDLGKFDKKKNLHIFDRKDNMIIVSGENIYPTEIEKFSNQIKNIKLSAVTSVKDRFTQNRLVMVYESRKYIKKEKILKFLFNKSTHFKVPKEIYHCKQLGLDEIPKAPNGKILRSKIRQIVQNHYI